MTAFDESIPALSRDRGPFSTVSLNASRASNDDAGVVELRFRDLADGLRRRGAPEADIDALTRTIREPHGGGGEITRLAAARNGETVADLVLPGAPARDECTFGPAVHLLPAIRASRRPTPYVVIDVDRAGADIQVVTAPPVPGIDSDSGGTEIVEGSQDVLHKVRKGGRSHRRMQARAEDSWDRNAAEIAAELGRITRDVAPVMVLISGDPYEVGAVTRALDGATAAITERIESGGRAAGIAEQPKDTAIDDALMARERTDRAALLDRFASAKTRQEGAVQGVGPVVDALRRGQVSDLLLHDDPTSTLTLWSGPEPLQIGMDTADLAAMGADDPMRMRADAVLTRAALAIDGDIRLLDESDPPLTDGVGALLRWSDRSTPYDAILAMPGHGQPPGQRGAG